MSQPKRKQTDLSSSTPLAGMPNPSAAVSSRESTSKDQGGKKFGFLNSRAPASAPSVAVANFGDFNISTPKNFQQKTHVDENWNWSGDNVSSEFALYEKLGSGAYGTVYRCVHQSSNKELAAKVLPLTKTEAGDIMKEVDVLKSVNHPNIVQYFGTCTTDGSLWILMDYCGKGSLADLLRKTPKQRFSEEQVGCLLIGVLKGLAYLHSKAIIHRDLKAGNILINDNGDVKIADFGVSAKISDQLAKTRTVIGTPLYMAPEMFEGGNYDFKTDIWSLGITIIELAQGKPPHYDVAPMQVIILISTSDPPTFDDSFEFTDLFKEFLSLTLQHDPKRRLNSELLLNHGFIQQVLTKDYQGLIQDLCNPDSEPKSQGTSSPASTASISGGSGEELRVIDDRYMPDTAEELKSLVLQLRHLIKTDLAEMNKNKGNDELLAATKKVLSDLEVWKKSTKKLEDELKEVIRKEKKLRETS